MQAKHQHHHNQEKVDTPQKPKLHLVEIEHPTAEDLEQQPWFDSVVTEFID